MTENITEEILKGRLRRISELTAEYPDSFNEALALDVIDFSAEEGWVDYRYDVKADHYNLYGGLHGGIIASLADDAGGAVACAFSGAYVSTATLSAEYLRAMNQPSYVIHVEVPHVGRRIVNTIIKIKEENTGRVTATAVASFAVISENAMPEY